MSSDPVKELIQYRIERAHETYEEAQVMVKSEHWNACINRLYYSNTKKFHPPA